MNHIFYNLDKGTILEIANQKYELVGYLTFVQNRYLWKEYKLIDEHNGVHWLSVEKNSKIKEVNFYESVRPYHIDEDGAVFENAEFLLLDSGKGRVTESVGIEDTTVNDVVSYKEFLAKEDATNILSYEKWSDVEEYSQGTIINKADIKISKLISLTEDDTQNAHGIPLKTMQDLALGQKMLVQGSEYSIVGYALYKQGSFEWIEYKLKSKNGKNRSEKWLCVEQIDDDYSVTIHDVINQNQVTVFVAEEQVSYKTQIFNKVESGSGRVMSHGGDTDFDNYEAFDFIEYEAEDGTLLSYEKWSDETEYSFGEEVSKGDIVLLKSNVTSYGPRKKRTVKRTFIIVAIVVILLGAISIPRIYEAINYPTITSQLPKKTNYQYVTSITLTDKKNTKVQVYETSADLDKTCKEIIDMDPEKITYVADASDTEIDGEKFIQTSRESILIYQGEDGKTYVQISKHLPSTSFIGYTPYRAMYSARVATFLVDSILAEAYANTDTEDSKENNHVNTWRYRNYWRSSRDASVTARQSSGGGTSYGK